ADAGGGNREPALPELIGNADLTEGRLLDRQRYDGSLDLLRHAVLQHRLLAADFLQRQFAALVVELLEAVEAVATVAHHFAGLADMASSSSPTLAPMIFCSVVMLSSNAPRRGPPPPRPLRPPPRLANRRGDPGHLCQVKF